MKYLDKDEILPHFNNMYKQNYLSLSNLKKNYKNQLFKDGYCHIKNFFMSWKLFIFTI